ncbi:protein of unknown function [Candidatus Nitrosacidococcus tergens]|uniref:Uncharacterized protein n=1 Tax=Candidatus Nitrosacidococcus tergens TaxID=553981 RepID=A0A7G1QBI3_9GAMM|nr:protein of unknown function [Candidatus Nitrosacidococcus tergens]
MQNLCLKATQSVIAISEPNSSSLIGISPILSFIGFTKFSTRYNNLRYLYF